MKQRKTEQPNWTFEPYHKHQLFTGDYKVVDGAVIPPKQCYWRVMRYLGSRDFAEPSFTDEGKGVIALILGEDYEKPLPGKAGATGFWPVISFLTKDEARALMHQLKTILK